MADSSFVAGPLLARNAVLNLLGQAVGLIGGIAFIPVLIGQLGVERFGLLALAWVFVGYFSLVDLGLGRAVTKFAAESFSRNEQGRVGELVWTAISVQVLLGLAATLIALACAGPLVSTVLKLSPHLRTEARGALQVLSLSIPIVLASSSLKGVLEGAQRFDLVNFVKAPATLAMFALPVLGAAVGLGLPGIVGLLVASRVVTLWLYWTLCSRSLPDLRAPVRINGALIRPLATYAGWLSVSNVLIPVLAHVDRFLIAALVSVSAVSYYVAPYEMVTRLWIFPLSLGAALFPAFSGLKGASDRVLLTDTYERSLKYLLFLILPVVLVVVSFGQDILQIWLGTQFSDQSTTVLQILALGVFVNSLAIVPFTLLQGLGRADLTAKFHLLELAPYLFLAWLLTTRLGIAGAAVAWSLRVTIDAALLSAASLRLLSGSANRAVHARVASAVAVAFIFLVGAFLGARAELSGLTRVGVSFLLLSIFELYVWENLLDDRERETLKRTVAHVGGAIGFRVR